MTNILPKHSSCKKQKQTMKENLTKDSKTTISVPHPRLIEYLWIKPRHTCVREICLFTFYGAIGMSACAGVGVATALVCHEGNVLNSKTKIWRNMMRPSLIAFSVPFAFTYLGFIVPQLKEYREDHQRFLKIEDESTHSRAR
jgi:hypothetical protein